MNTITFIWQGTIQEDSELGRIQEHFSHYAKRRDFFDISFILSESDAI